MTTKVSNQVLGADSVDSAQIKTSAVTSTKLAAGAVTSAAIATGAVTSTAFATGAVGSTALAAGAVGSTALASGAVTSTKIGTGAVTSGAIAAGAVIAAGIATGAVTTTAIGDASVTADKLSDSSVTTSKIQDGAVTAAKLGVSVILQGQHTIWVPAKAMTSTVTNGASPGSTDFASTNYPTVSYLSFSGSTNSYAEFCVGWPKSWDKGSVTIKLYWMSPTNTGGVAWGFGVLGRNNGNALNGTAFTYPSEAITVATAASTNVVYATQAAASITMSNTGNIEDAGFIQIYRIPANGGDTIATPVYLLGALIKYTISSTNDA